MLFEFEAARKKIEINTGRFLYPFQSLLPLIVPDLVYTRDMVTLLAGSGIVER